MIFLLFVFIFSTMGNPINRHEDCLLLVAQNASCYRPYGKSGPFLCVKGKFSNRKFLYTCPIEDPNFHPGSTTITTTTLNTTTSATIKTTIFTFTSTQKTLITPVMSLPPKTIFTPTVSNYTSFYIWIGVIAVCAIFLLAFVFILFFRAKPPQPPPRPPPPNRVDNVSGVQIVPLREISAHLAESRREFETIANLLKQQLEERRQQQKSSSSSDFSSENTIVDRMTQGPFVDISLDEPGSVYFDTQSRMG